MNAITKKMQAAIGEYTKNETDPTLKLIAKYSFRDGIISDIAKEYHTQGMYTQEQVDNMLDQQACITTAQMLDKHKENSLYTEEDILDLITEFSWRLDKNITFKQWFSENKKK